MERVRHPGRQRRRLIGMRLAAVLVVPAAVGGCGGTSTLTHAQLGAKANQACSQATATAGRLGSPPATYAGLADYARKLSPIVEKLIGNLQTLNASATDRQALNNYVSALTVGNHGLVLLEKASSPAALSQATTAVEAGAMPTLASALGAPKCAVSPTSS
jgi:hypothetical protein